MRAATERAFKGQPDIELESRSASNSSIRKRSLDGGAHDSDSDGEADGDEDLPLYEGDPLASPMAVPKAPSTSPRYVVIMCSLFIFMVELSMYVTDPALQMIMEDVACHDHFPDHKIGDFKTEDARCKDAGVQGTLAMSRSWMMWASLFVRESQFPLIFKRCGCID
jgi:hypothetical protein